MFIFNLTILGYKNHIENLLFSNSCADANSLLQLFLNTNREEGPMKTLDAQTDAQVLI